MSIVLSGTGLGEHRGKKHNGHLRMVMVCPIQLMERHLPAESDNLKAGIQLVFLPRIFCSNIYSCGEWMLVVNGQNQSADLVDGLSVVGISQKNRFFFFLYGHRFFFASEYDSIQLEGIRLV